METFGLEGIGGLRRTRKVDRPVVGWRPGCRVAPLSQSEDPHRGSPLWRGSRRWRRAAGGGGAQHAGWLARAIADDLDAAERATLRESVELLRRLADG
jgi:hypothetical protein